MNIYQLQYFRTMARVQHYTQASKILCITQPSLSNAIASLEDDLGANLFEKQGRNVVLSRNGKVFLEYVERALDEIKAGTDKIKELTGNLQAPINVGFIYTLSSHLIPSLICGFRRSTSSAPDFVLCEGGTLNECTPGLIKGLKNGELDMIFVSLIPKETDVEFIPICEQELVAIVPCNSPLSDNDSLDLEHIDPYPLIHYAGKAGLKKEINRMFEKVGITPKVACEVEDEVAIAGLVAGNMGIAIVPDSPVFKNFRVKTLPISNPSYHRIIYLGLMKNRPASQPIQQFRDYAIQHAREIMNSVEGSL